jgi:hypothetical protein
VVVLLLAQLISAASHICLLLLFSAEQHPSYWFSLLLLLLYGLCLQLRFWLRCCACPWGSCCCCSAGERSSNVSLGCRCASSSTLHTCKTHSTLRCHVHKKQRKTVDGNAP